MIQLSYILSFRKFHLEENVFRRMFDIIDTKAAKKKDNSGKERDITKVKVKMHHAVRDDLLRYLQSSIKEKVEE